MNLSYLSLGFATAMMGLAGALAFSGCASTIPVDIAPLDGGPGGEGGAGGLCTSCTTSADCNGGVCAQFQGDSFCAQACPNGDDCGAAFTCSAETSYAGEQVSVCVPKNNACGGSVGPGSSSDAGPPRPACDAGASSNPNQCGTYVGPSAQASCHSCTSSGSSCQPNGCYGGWWCDTSTNRCHAPPTNCPPSGGGGGGAGCNPTPPPIDAGPGMGPVTGSVGGNGGSISRLYFTVVGDTRPPSPDDTSNYPVTVINQIYSDIAALNPQPPFSVSTGDYMFASTSGGQASPQLDMYLAARAKYAGAFFPAMGNHECTGATASNCGQGNTDGVTDNMTQFVSKMLAPIQKSAVYYSVNINATDNSWTSKFVFVAANAWDSGQSSWLSGVMAQQTTYTFVIRHESSGTSGPPGVSPSDQIINGFPYTLLIVGHSHTYGHPNTKEVLFGNGGAPLTGSGNYGFGVIAQRQDGALTVDMYDYQSNQPDPSFHFVITPAGTITQ